MEKNEKAMAARAASAPWETPLLIVVRCHWFARKQKATNHRKDKKPGGEWSWSVPALLRSEEHKPAALEIFREQQCSREPAPTVWPTRSCGKRG